MKLTPMASPVVKRVYDTIMACETDDEARLYSAMIAGAGIQYDMITHHDIVQKRVDEIVDLRVTRIRKSLAREIIMKSKAGKDISKLLQESTEISKVGFTDEERSANARRQDRDAGGRFKTEHRRINYSGGKKPVSAKEADKLGIASATVEPGLSNADKLAYQEAYQQVQNSLHPFVNQPGAKVHYGYQTAHGVTTTELKDFPTVENGRPLPQLNETAFKNGGRLTHTRVLYDTKAEQSQGDIAVQGAAFDLAGALGEGTGNVAAQAFERNPNGRFAGADQLGTFAGDWNQQVNQDIGNPRAKVYRRLSLGSRLLESSLGPLIPARARLAIQTADFVGQYGSEADKVIGPHADKAAYRYRGIERKPDPMLQANINGFRRKFPNDDSARNALIYGSEEQHMTRNGVVTESRPSPIIEYFRGRLSDKDLVRLQAQSGVIPPSEGMIINRKGQVVTQAVGYGEDWYLPFNLKTLSKVKGGEYIRTRAWGGPTTEDIYAGLISGAKSVTVISHNGVYTVEFDDSFRGSRRYNDKAARMVNRYGHLLDAVKSQEVTLAGIPEDRMLELRTEAAKRYNPKLDRAKFTERLEELKRDERIEPQMSQARKQQTAIEFLDERAVNLPAKYGSDTEPQWTDFATNYIDRNVATARLNQPTYAGAPEFDEEFARLQAAAQVATPTQVINVAGLGQQWDKFLEGKQSEYVAEQKPLELNGPGYDKALKALKEQFPYYIASTSYQPVKIGGSDVGYVKPRFNRPERALAGYYDTSIGGVGAQLTREGKATGKVTADQIRWQNGGPASGVFQRRGGPTPKPEATPGGTNSPIVPGSGQPSELAQTIKGQKAVEDAWQYVQENLPPGVLTEHLKGAGFPLLGGSRDDLMAAYAENPTKLRDRLGAEVSNLERKPEMQGLTLPAAMKANLKNPSHNDTGDKYSDFLGISQPNKTYDFGAELAPGRKAVEYEDSARRMMNQIGIETGDFHVDSPEFKTQLDEMYKLDVDTVRRAESNPIGIDRSYVDEAKNRIRSNIRARQALRRFGEAQKAEVEEEALRERRDAQFGFQGIQIVLPPGAEASPASNQVPSMSLDDELKRLTGHS